MSGTIGDNVYRASGVIASAAGGGTSWQSVETGATFTAVAGNGYPVNTTAQACTVTLPASASVGDTIEFIDYARKWGTNALTIDQNSLNFQGATTPNPEYDTSGQSVTIVYVDATQGWIPTVDDDVTYETPQPYDVDILVVAGGGSGGKQYAGAGGAGGLIYKTSHEVTGGQQYDVVIGAGGAGQAGSSHVGAVGVDTTWTLNGGATEFTAKGGGGGGQEATAASDGGSGGGAGYDVDDAGSETQTGQAGDSGTYGFGNDGGQGSGPGGDNHNPGGGGGAGGAGDDGASTSGNGGVGKDYSAVFANEGDSGWFASGGGGGYTGTGGSAGGTASSGGGTDGGSGSGASSSAAQANTGGGSGGGASENGGSGNGGSGVICLKILTANYADAVVTGSPTTRVVGDYTIVEFTGDGSYTA